MDRKEIINESTSEMCVPRGFPTFLPQWQNTEASARLVHTERVSEYV